MSDWKVLSKKEVFDDGWRRLESWKTARPDGKEKDFTMVMGRDVVAVFGITDDNRVLILKEFYNSAEKRVYSLVAGIVEDMGIKKTAECELREEAGCVAKEMIYLGFSLRGKYIAGSVHYFLAKGVENTCQQELESFEDITMEFISLSEFRKLLQNCEIQDEAEVACAYLALDYLNKL